MKIALRAVSNNETQRCPCRGRLVVTTKNTLRLGEL